MRLNHCAQWENCVRFVCGESQQQHQKSFTFMSEDGEKKEVNMWRIQRRESQVHINKVMDNHDIFLLSKPKTLLFFNVVQLYNENSFKPTFYELIKLFESAEEIGHIF